MAAGQEHQHISHLQCEHLLTKETSIRTIDDLIRYVEKYGNKSLCCAAPGGREAYIKVVKNGETKYLQTYADNVLTNNLLSLPLV